MMKECILVIGAGMAGLCTALALAPGGREVLLLERDPSPPGGGADEAFTAWERRGVGQLRHSHAFLARLRNIIKASHPGLLDALHAAGVRELGFEAALPARLREAYRAKPGDADLAVLTSRRTTLELVMRRYVEGLAGVSVLSDAFVRELTIEPAADGALRVAGVCGEIAGAREAWRADLVVDASGRGSASLEQLKAAGAAVSEDAEDCGILYYTRHYRLLDGAGEPKDAGPGTGDLGFVKYGLFPGDNRCFSVTLAAPEIEPELRQVLVRPEGFERVCSLLPGLAPWTDPAIAEPLSRVFGMGDLKSVWRGYVAPDQRAVLGFFAVGDSLIRTDPLFGRGCAFAAVEAQVLAGVLDETADPAARARLYDARIRAELTPYFEAMRAQDRAAVRRARNLQDPGYDPPLRARVRASFFEDGARIAVRSDIALLRAALRDFHMVDPPGAWMREPENIAKIMRWWARGKRRNAALYPPPLGPGRAEMFQRLGL
jgi:2-polyprenyl-6-methoxyphenol hydroxylase-like FAD-dependent oxidoreductase